MTTALLDVEIADLERQLAAAKVQVAAFHGETPVQTFSDLYGIFAGQMNCTDEDIEAAKYHPKLDWLEDEEKAA